MTNVFLALGSNVGDREKNIRKAVELLKRRISDITTAPIYESKAAEYENQPNFLNTALKGYTKLAPRKLLMFVKEIEKEIGRIERFRWGPREIDIDIIFYGATVCKDAALEIPHPRAHQRDFVLRPLADLEPSLLHPVFHRQVRELLDSLPIKTALIINSE